MKSPVQKRPEQLSKRYAQLIDRHLDELLSGRAADMFEIETFAALMFLHPTHLSNTIKEVTGTSACGIYQEKIMERTLQLLDDRALSIRQIALKLTFEPSQFTKWFKRINGITPKQYRNGFAVSHNTEIKTIF